MEVGIGLPATIPGVERAQLLEWAARAERRGFSSLGTIDRIVYGNCEPLIALAAAAAVTERIRLATTILIAPYRGNAALVAKQAATLDVLSGGRLVLGVAVGGREDDYSASEVDFRTRGRRFEQMLERWQRIWTGERFGSAGAIGPRPPKGRPTLLMGGSAAVVFERAARYADGWIMGGGSPENLKDGIERLNTAWAAAGRDGTCNGGVRVRPPSCRTGTWDRPRAPATTRLKRRGARVASRHMDRFNGLDVPETLDDALRPQTLALLVYDMQVGVLGQISGAEEVLANVLRVLDAARERNVRTIFLRHYFMPTRLAGAYALRQAKLWQRQARAADTRPLIPYGSPEFELVPEVVPEPHEAVVDKVTMSAFEGTPLDIVLRDCGVRSYLIVGVALEVGIEPTVRHSADLGYVPVVVRDACGAGNAEAAERSLRALDFAGDALIADTAEVCAALARSPVAELG